MPEKATISIDFSQEDACAKILPRAPLVSSYREKWDGIRLDYHQQPAHETPEHSPQQLVIGINLSHKIHIERFLDGQRKNEQMACGDIAVVPANCSHLVQCPSDTEFLLLSLETSFLTHAAYDSLELKDCEIRPHFASPDPMIQQIALALKSELDSDTAGTRIYIQSLATTLSLHLLRYYSVSGYHTATDSHGLSRLKLRKIIEYIDQNLDKDLTLDEIATEAGISMYHFSRLFKQSTGSSPHQYVMNRRIEKAKRLLTRTEEAIDQISQQVGFQSQSHFTNVFRKLMGTTPKAYRKQLQV